MICWKCDEYEAHGVCAFCGRAVCRYCAQERLRPLQVYSHDGTLALIGTIGAIWCGMCEMCDPIAAPELAVMEEL